jgi:7,8-dihydropterin-6-yl-methyl-4-(beta-D-ribofuranosyl)aminobenzene 5'-phosphate synthase
MGHGRRRISAIADELKETGVKKIAPSHCTGDDAIQLLKACWQNDFIDAGCGAVISI